MLLFQTNAQNNNYYNRMQHVFGNIDKAKVTTGYLKEFGVRFNTIEDYSGTNSANNFVDKTQWQSLYSSLYTMRVGTIAQNMTTTNTVFDFLKTQQENSTTDVLLAMQHYKYQQYKTNAVSNGDVTISNDRIYDVAGRNPYTNETVFAIAPLKKELQGNTFTFKLPNNLIYTNSGLTINQLQIDFDNGQGYQTVSLNTNKSISYSSGGVKELNYKIIYTNSTIVYSHSKILVNYKPNYQARYSGFGGGIIRDSIAGSSWQGAFSTGYITVELAPGHTQITKPLIVVEGFDPNNSFDYFDLIDEDSPGGLQINITGTTLNQAIEDEDYDLIFVDYKKGTDYIQRNAYMVEEVIKWVNIEKNRNGNPNAEKNVVLGMSMGGLVARYALRHMEQTNQTHDTKLYISHDTPHQGANVPLGVQAMARHLYGEEISLPVFLSLFDVTLFNFSDIEGLGTAFDLLQSPAAQQMLIYQLQGDGNNVNHTTNALSTAFYNEYHTMGNPTQGGIKNIAISNGAECSVNLPFADNASLINLDEKIDLPWFITNIVLTSINSLSLNPLKIISSSLSTDTDFTAVMRVKSLPNQQSKEIYHGDVFISKTILFAITVHEQIINDESLNSQPSMLPLDNASGGIYDVENFVGNLPASFNNYILEREFNFVPTYSSLNVGGGNQTITYADLNNTYSPLSPPTGLKSIPFDNFYTNPIKSTNHIQFTLNNGNWLIDELKGVNGFNTCAASCSDNLNLTIIGSNIICENTFNTYSVSDIPNQVNVNWSVSPSNSFSLTNNNNTLTLIPNSNYVGEATITANIATNCEDNINTPISLNKTIWVGKPLDDLVMISSGGFTLSTGNFYQLRAAHETVNYLAHYNLNYEWLIPYAQIMYSNNNKIASVKPTQTGTYPYKLRAKNVCGCSDWLTRFFNVQNSPDDDDLIITPQN